MMLITHTTKGDSVGKSLIDIITSYGSNQSRVIQAPFSTPNKSSPLPTSETIKILCKSGSTEQH